MKRAKQLFREQAAILGMLCLIATLFTSCLKQDDDDYVQTPAALISVINALPGTQAVDFYLDQNKGNTYPINYGNGLDYIRAYTGKRTPSFNLSNTSQKLKSDTITLKADNFYSAYLTGTVAQPEILLLRDSITRPTTGMAAIRLVHVSANAPAVDLAIKDGAVLATNKSYKGYSPFVAIQAAKTYTIEVRLTGTTTVLASLTDVRLNNNSVYTVWLQGVNNATDDTKLSAKLQENVYYN